MKKHLLFFISILMSFSLMGQTNPPVFQNHKSLKERNIFEKLGRNTDAKAEKKSLFKSNINFKKNVALKSTQVDKQSLDSLIYKAYNSDTDQMEVFQKLEFTYDVNGYNTIELNSNWDNSTSQWVGDTKSEYTYDPNGNATIEIDSDWDSSTNQWLSYSKYENAYDVNGNNTVEIDSYWDNSISQWLDNNKTEYTYDVNGNNTIEIYSSWDNSSSLWLENSKSEYTYDVNGNKTVELYSYWDNSTSQWLGNSKNESTYDVNGNKTVELYSYWDNSTSQWLDNSKTEYTYDVNGNSTMEIYSYWDNSISQWAASSKSEYTYDLEGNNIIGIYYDWDDNTAQWVGDSKDEYTYNNSYSFGDLILPNSFDGDAELFGHMITAAYLYSWNASTSNWDNDFIVDVFYSSQTISSIPNQSMNIDFEVYPNPASDYIVFDLQNKTDNFLIEFFDVTGRNVLNQELSDNNTVNVSSLKRGIYIYKLSVDGEAKSGKIVIK